jgi:alkylresorcinol/alkylpyrone synthase
MPRLLSIGTALPPYQLKRADARAVAAQVFSKHPHIGRLLDVFDSSGIDQRYFTTPPEWFLSQHSPESVNRTYIESATDLSEAAVRLALERSSLTPADIDYLVYVNTTGLATPSIDARLLNRLGCRRDAAHLPVWGRGCAGGAAGISHVSDYLRGQPEGVAVIVAAEFCGLTFLPGDLSKSNIVASALFGDGVGAAVVGGANVDRPGLEIVRTRSRLFPDSLEIMGWNITSQGLQVVFNRRIPDIVREHAAEDLDALLGSAGVGRGDVVEYLYHPGGPKVLDSYREAYGLNADAMHLAKAVLKDCGNMSSATLMFVLERFFMQQNRATDGYAAASALGPGFCSESFLLKLS